MDSISREYHDLDLAIDDVRALLNRWANEISSRQAEAPQSQSFHYTQLVLHEWFANLVQHANFPSSPRVHVRLSVDATSVHCTVDDNSEGFDFGTRLSEQSESVEQLPERGMGLRIIDACTDDFSYTRRDDGTHRFEFSIPSDHEPWLTNLF